MAENEKATGGQSDGQQKFELSNDTFFNVSCQQNLTPAKYLKALYGGFKSGIVTICEIPKNGGKPKPFHFPVVALGAALKQAQKIIKNHCYLTTGIFEKPPIEGRGVADKVGGLSYFWADIDTKEGVHKKENLPTRDEARSFIDNFPLKPSAIVDSGGGYYPIWIFKEPAIFASEVDRKNIKNLSQKWQEFIIGAGKSQGWNFDSTGDLCRLLRMPGTYNVKFKDPVMCQVIHLNGARYSIDDFKKCIKQNTAKVFKWDGDFNSLPIKQASKDLIKFKVPQGQRSEAMMTVLNSLVGAGLNDAEIIQVFEAEAIGEKYREKSQGRKRWLQPQIDKARKKVTDNVTALRISPNVTANITIEEIINAAFAGQKGCSSLFIKLFRDKFCYDHSAKMWFFFDRHFWKVDSIGATIEACDEIQNLFQKALSKIASDTILKANERAQTIDENAIKKIETNLKQYEANRKAVEGVKHNLNCLGFRKQVVEFAAMGKNSLGISGDCWDSQPWLLACKNGVVDLKTGKIRAGKPEDYLKSFCPTIFEPDTECPNFERFVFEILGDDPDTFVFLQTLLGAALIGESTYKQFLPIFSGQGRNGKDTLMGVIGHVLGPELCAPIQAELLLDTGKTGRSSQGPSPDKMKLRGLRIAYCNETSQGRRFNTSTVKMLSGGGSMSARPLHGQEVSWEQTQLLILMTNNRPHAPVDDYAFWQRIKNIHFPLSFVNQPEAPNEKKADPHLSEKLKKEASGILNWLIDGCLEYQKNQCALKDPEAVKAASREYLKEVDLIGLFIEDFCFVGNSQVTAKDIYAAYRQWAVDGGQRPLSQKAFGLYMKKRFDNGKDTAGRRCYRGIGLLSE